MLLYCQTKRVSHVFGLAHRPYPGAGHGGGHLPGDRQLEQAGPRLPKARLSGTFILHYPKSNPIFRNICNMQCIEKKRDTTTLYMKYSAKYHVFSATFHVTVYRGKSITFGTVCVPIVLFLST